MIIVMETIYDDGESRRIQRTTEDFDTVNGVDDITTPINLNLTPARVIHRWGQWIKVGLMKNLGQTLTIDIGFGPVTSFFPTYIKFNKSEVLNSLSTVRSDESIEIFENQDIDPNNFDDPIFTGDTIEVLADLTYQDIKSIEENPDERIDVPDEISGERVQGWPIIASIKPVGDTLSNLKLKEATTVTAVDKSMIWNSGESIDWNSGEPIDWNK